MLQSLLMRRRALFIFLCLAPAMAAVAQGDANSAHYLIVEGKVFSLKSLRREGEVYLPLVESAAALGFSASARGKGLALERAGGSVVFSDDFSMVLSGNRVQRVEPPVLAWDGALYIAQSALRGILGRLSPPFSLSDTAPKMDLKSMRCRWKAEGQDWILDFSSPASPELQYEKGELKIFVQGARIEMKAEGSLPENVSVQHEKLPLGDRLLWRWSATPPARPRLEKEGDSLYRVVFLPGAAESARRPLRVVVLDPGHGGEAAGAVGKGGAMEKDVVLEIALVLKGLLEERGFVVHMTRDSDQDVPLLERAEMANSRKGGLFVSIHANASRSASAKGVETYCLSYEALDDESRMAAQRENLGVAAPGVSASGENPLQSILWHMAQAQFLQDSMNLAEEIQRRFNASLSTPDRGVRQAPFAVLMGAAMPAVLVEVGFLSNESEEARLQDPDYRRRLAQDLAGSIDAFRRKWDARLETAPAAASGGGS
jgi:N-acetylmuramoyl-L-alanine amidase